MTEYLDVADFLLIAEAVLGVPAERIADWPGVGRAGSALQAPAASFGGVEFWTVGADLDRFDLITGPATHRKPPQMGRGDLVLFHAVIHVRLFAAAEILDNPNGSVTRSGNFAGPGSTRAALMSGCR